MAIEQETVGTEQVLPALEEAMNLLEEFNLDEVIIDQNQCDAELLRFVQQIFYFFRSIYSFIANPSVYTAMEIITTGIGIILDYGDLMECINA